MAKPVLAATFQPQYWGDDHAVNFGRPYSFDATPALLSLTADQIRRLGAEASKTSGRDLDILAERSGLVANCGFPDGHDGPFVVNLDMDLRTFLQFDLGIDDIAALSDNDLVRIRDGYADYFVEVDGVATDIRGDVDLAMRQAICRCQDYPDSAIGVLKSHDYDTRKGWDATGMPVYTWELHEPTIIAWRIPGTDQFQPPQAFGPGNLPGWERCQPRDEDQSAAFAPSVGGP